jgi:hypothetical protein
VNIANRIEKLEQKTSAGERKAKLWVIIKGEPEPAGIEESDMVVTVIDAETKELIAKVKDRTTKLIVKGTG